MRTASVLSHAALSLLGGGETQPQLVDAAESMPASSPLPIPYSAPQAETPPAPPSAVDPVCAPVTLEGSPALLCAGEGYQTYVFPKASVSECSVVAEHGATRGTPYIGDTYDPATCHPVGFFGHPAVECVGETTTMTYVPVLEPRPLENLGGNIALGAVLVRMAVDMVQWFRSSGSKEAKVRELLPTDELVQPLDEMKSVLDAVERKLHADTSADKDRLGLKKWYHGILQDHRGTIQNALADHGMTQEELQEFRLDVERLQNDVGEDFSASGFAGVIGQKNRPRETIPVTPVNFFAPEPAVRPQQRAPVLASTPVGATIDDGAGVRIALA